MAKRFGAPLTNADGSLATGLAPAPTATLYNAATGGVIQAVAASDPAGVGFWIADFSGYDPTLDVFAVIDGTAAGLASVIGQGVAFAVDVVPTVNRDGVRVDRDSAIEFADSCHFSAAYTDTVASEVLKLKAWLSRRGVLVTPTAIAITIRNQAGTVLASYTEADAEVTGPNADGAYLLVTVANDVVLTSDQAYSVDIAITDALGTITTERGMPTF